MFNQHNATCFSILPGLPHVVIGPLQMNSVRFAVLRKHIVMRGGMAVRMQCLKRLYAAKS